MTTVHTFIQFDQVGIDTGNGHVESLANSASSPVQSLDNFVQAIQAMGMTIDDLMVVSLDTIHLYHNRQSSFKKEHGLKAANLLLDLQDMLENTEDRGTSPSYGLTSLTPQSILPSPVECPHVEETIQDAVVDTSLLLFHGASNSNVVPPKGVIIVTVPQGIIMPTTSSHIAVGQLHTTQDGMINNLEGYSISW